MSVNTVGHVAHQVSPKPNPRRNQKRQAGRGKQLASDKAA